MTGLWRGSLRRRLVIGVAAVHAVLMTIFVVDLVARQASFMAEQERLEASALASALALSASPWLLARDSEGMREVTTAIGGYPDVRWAMLLSPELQVLGHTEPARVGQWLEDDPAAPLRGHAQEGFVVPIAGGVDAIAPIRSGSGRHLGWARVTLGDASIHRATSTVVRDGLLYVLLAIVLGTAFAVVLARSVVADLDRLVGVSERAATGLFTPSGIHRSDEVGRLAAAFDAMLGALEAARAAEARSAALRRELVQGERMQALGRLAGGVAHDFNNMLAANTAHVRLAREASTDAQQQRDLDDALVAADRAQALVAQILTFARGEPVAGGVADPHEAAAELLRLLRPSFGETQLALAPASAPLRVRCSPTCLRQLLTNLVFNAREAAGPTGRVELSTRAGEVEGRCASCGQAFEGAWVELAVRDDGPGIPADVAPHVFEPFFTTRQGKGGNGLGLSTVHGAVHAAGGHVLLDSRPGETLFRLLLPAAVELPPGEATTTPAEAPLRAQAPGQRLLVIDDEPLVGRSLARLLGRRGFEVVFDTDAAAGLAHARAERWQAVITDFAMPGMNGLELARELRVTHPGQRIVLCTGNPLDLGDTHEVDAVLQKPVDLDALVRACVAG